MLLKTGFALLLDTFNLADQDQGYSVIMGDVNYQDKIENNRGVIMGHAHSTATDGVRITGSSTTVNISLFLRHEEVLIQAQNNYHGTKPGDGEAE